MVDPSARWIAAARARESARPDRLFDDPWAALLADGADPGPENRFLPVRTRYFDDAIAGAGPLDQLVLPGAGLDTRAWRLPLPPGVTVFELDRPGVLGAKRERIAQAPPVPLRQVDADLAGPDWTRALLDAGFDPGARTLWVAEGLLFHLSPQAVDGLLTGAATLSEYQARFLADVFGTGLLRLPGIQVLPRTPFCTDDPAGLFRRAGWARCRWDLAGSPAANFGRLGGRQAGGDPGMRTYLVNASV